MDTTRGRRPRRDRETSELLEATRRLIRAIGRRDFDEDPEAVADLLALEGFLSGTIADVVREQRKRGMTWQAIGDAVGTTRQAALMRWSRQ